MIRAPAEVLTYTFPSGYAGTVATVRLMGEWVRKRCGHPQIRARVRELFAGLPSLDEEGELDAVWRFIVDNVRYMRDTLGSEHITDPLELDREIEEGTAAEDCESIAAYAATLFAASGRRSLFDLQEQDPRFPGELTHAALVVDGKRGRGFVSFDPVGAAYYPDTFELGDTLAKPGKRRELWTLDGDQAPNLDGGDMYRASSFGDLCFGDTTTEADAFKIVDQVSNTAASLGPYGAIAAGLAQAGKAIYQAASPAKKPPPGKDPNAIADKAKGGKSGGGIGASLSTGTKIGLGVAGGAAVAWLLTRGRRRAA